MVKKHEPKQCVVFDGKDETSRKTMNFVVAKGTTRKLHVTDWPADYALPIYEARNGTWAQCGEISVVTLDCLELAGCKRYSIDFTNVPANNPEAVVTCETCLDCPSIQLKEKATVNLVP